LTQDIKTKLIAYKKPRGLTIIFCQFDCIFNLTLTPVTLEHSKRHPIGVNYGGHWNMFLKDNNYSSKHNSLFPILPVGNHMVF